MSCGSTASREGATLVELEVPWLCATEAEICDAVDAQLGKLAREHPELQLRYAFLDHVSSQPAVLLPVKRLVALCRQHGAEEVCVDGAHAVGSVPDLDVVDIDADFFLHELSQVGLCTQHCVGAALTGPKPDAHDRAPNHKLGLERRAVPRGSVPGHA